MKIMLEVKLDTLMEHEVVSTFVQVCGDILLSSKTGHVFLSGCITFDRFYRARPHENYLPIQRAGRTIQRIANICSLCMYFFPFSVCPLGW